MTHAKNGPFRHNLYIFVKEMSLKLLSLLSSPYWYQERRFDISICSFLKNVVCFIGGHFCDYYSGVMLHASSLMRFAYGSNSTGYVLSSRWRHNDRDGVSNHEPHGRLIKRLFRRRSRKASKLRVNGFCEGNSPVTGGFPAQKASDVENVSIWWRHNVMDQGDRVLMPAKEAWRIWVNTWDTPLRTTVL